MSYVVCAGCGVAKIPAAKVEAWGGKCPRCNGVEQKVHRPWKRRVSRGNTICKHHGCRAQIPLSKVKEWNGLCPLHNGVQQPSRRRINSLATN